MSYFRRHYAYFLAAIGGAITATVIIQIVSAAAGADDTQWWIDRYNKAVQGGSTDTGTPSAFDPIRNLMGPPVSAEECTRAGGTLKQITRTEPSSYENGVATEWTTTTSIVCQPPLEKQIETLRNALQDIRTNQQDECVAYPPSGRAPTYQQNIDICKERLSHPYDSATVQTIVDTMRAEGEARCKHFTTFAELTRNRICFDFFPEVTRNAILTECNSPTTIWKNMCNGQSNSMYPQLRAFIPDPPPQQSRINPYGPGSIGIKPNIIHQGVPGRIHCSPRCL